MNIEELYAFILKALQEEGYKVENYTDVESKDGIIEVITYEVDAYLDRFDGFNFIERDIGRYQRRYLIQELYNKLKTERK